MRRRICTTIYMLASILALPCTFASAQVYSAGILFPGIGEEQYKQVLDLTPEKALDLPTAFSLSFDISIWNPAKYGEVFLLKADNGFVVRLVYDCSTATDTSFFLLAIADKKSGIAIPIAKSNLHRGAWHKLEFIFDCSSKTVTGKLNSQTLCRSSIEVGLQDLVSARLQFGHAEDPAMAVREIRLAKVVRNEHVEVLHHWRCCEFDGVAVHDFVGGAHGRQHGLTWLAPLHTHWHAKDSYPFSSYQPFLPKDSRAYGSLIFPDLRNNELVSFDSARFTHRSLRTGKQWTEKVGVSWVSDVVLDTVNDRLLRFQVGGGKVSVFDKLQKKWIPDFDYGNPDSMHYYGARAFVNPLNGDLLMFGGYGWFTASNLLQRYDFDKKLWEGIQTQGERIEPRSDFGLCQGEDSSSIFIFGGDGNETGRQQEGFHRIFDLWKLDLRTYAFTRLWKGNDVFPSRGIFRIIRGEDPDRIYVLAHENRIPVTRSIAYEFSLSRKTLTAIADTLVDHSSGDLWFDRDNRQLVHFPLKQVGRDSGAFVLYTLEYPPLREAEIKAALSGFDDQGSSDIRGWLWSTLILTAGAIGAFVLIRRKMYSKNVQTSPIFSDEAKPDRNCILLFGEFDFLDAQGASVVKKLSPQQRELLLLILLHSPGPGNTHISTEKLTALLWPDAGIKESKNVRGVAMNKLRESLAAVGPVEIVHESHSWRIEFGNNFTCDYTDYCRAYKTLKHGNGNPDVETLKSVARLLRRGLLLSDLSYEWLDPLRSSLIDEVTKLCLGIIKGGSHEDEIVLQVAQVLMKWDPLNEQALAAALKILMKDGRSSLANRTYEMFCKEFKRVFNKTYLKSLQQLLG